MLYERRLEGRRPCRRIGCITVPDVGNIDIRQGCTCRNTMVRERSMLIDRQRPSIIGPDLWAISYRDVKGPKRS